MNDPSEDAVELPADDPRDGAHDSLEVLIASQEAIERVWVTYWKPTLMADGAFNLAQLKAELYDAFHLVNEARKVYKHVTGGLCDNLCASGEGIIAMADRRVAELQVKLLERIAELEHELDAMHRREGGF